MTDSEKWDRGVAALEKEYALLSPGLKVQLDKCAHAVKSRKEQLHKIVSEVRAAHVCAQCLGECCKGGKNHVTVVDLLIYMGERKRLFTPAFELGICPYLGKTGCVMKPEYRPLNCITFNCERIEEALEPLERDRFYAVEGELREFYNYYEQLFDNSFRYGLLSNYERSLACMGAPILRGAALGNASCVHHGSSSPVSNTLATGG
jgi:hypothetical protein